MSKKRLYVGFLLPKIWQEKIKKLEQALPSKNLRWTKGENLHLTYFFIGEIGESKSGQIANALESVAFKTRPFNITFDKLTYAPLEGEYSMIWMMFKFSHEFGFLMKDIKKEIDQITIVDEEIKKNIPHITLARFKTKPNFALPNLTLKEGEMTLDRMALIEAQSRRDEMEHRVVKEYFFKSYRSEKQED